MSAVIDSRQPIRFYRPDPHVRTPEMRSPDYVQMSTAAAITLACCSSTERTARLSASSGTAARPTARPDPAAQLASAASPGHSHHDLRQSQPQP